MADGVELNAGSGGATAATDDCGAAGHAQIIKLAISTDGSATPIPADGTNGLDVDVTRVIPGTSATHLGKAEDAAHSSGDTGVAALAVRQDTATQLAGTDGDYSPLLTDATGRLHVNPGTVTVSGTVTANAGTNLNTSALALETGGNLAGAATSLAVLDDWDESDRAKVNPIVGQAGVQGGSGAVSATTQRVVLATDVALPAGTNAIGKLAANSGVDIGDVDVASVIPGTGATNLGKAEDAAHASGDVGVMALGVRQSSQADFGADGDYVPLSVDDDGGLRVSIVAGAGSGGTAAADDADFTDGTTQFTPIGGVYESTPSTVTDGDMGIAGITEERALKVHIAGSDVSGSGGTSAADDADFTAGTTAGTPVMGVYESTPSSVTDGDLGTVGITETRELKVAVTSGGIAGVVEDAASAGGEEGLLALAVRRDSAAVGSGTDGDFSTLNVNSTGRLYTTATIDAALPAGTNAIGKLAANTGVDIGDVDVTSVVPGTAAASLGKAEDAAHASGDTGVMLLTVRQNTAAALSGTDGDYQPAITDSSGRMHTVAVASGVAADDAAASGSPVLIAGVAVETDGTDPTTVSAEGDAAHLRTDRARRLLVSDMHPRFFNVSADYASAQTNASVQAAPGAGLKLYITDIEISNGATAGNITLLDGSGGTVKFEIYPAINGGIVTNRRTPIVLTANTALCITSTTVTTHSVNIGGYIAP